MAGAVQIRVPDDRPVHGQQGKNSTSKAGRDAMIDQIAETGIGIGLAIGAALDMEGGRHSPQNSLQDSEGRQPVAYIKLEGCK